MGRVLFAWEFGSNLGHLSRLLPLAERLVSRGHQVQFVVRDSVLAEHVLKPVGIPYIVAPQASSTGPISGSPVSYADLLWRQAWSDGEWLRASVNAWVRLLKEFDPAVAVVDYAPTALLAMHVSGTAKVLIGTGFELPPQRSPIPPFPGFSGATVEVAAKIENQLLERANAALSIFGDYKLNALHELFHAEHRWITTFAELDPYGSRKGECYVGPLGVVLGKDSARWPEGGATQRVVAYVRPHIVPLVPLLETLVEARAAVVCYAPGISNDLIERLQSPRVLFSRAPIDFASLAKDATLAVSYGSAATVAEMALHGIPQLLAPVHIESQLTAHRIDLLGLGLVIRPESTRGQIARTLQRLLQGVDYGLRAKTFSKRQGPYQPDEKRDQIVESISRMANLAPHRPLTSKQDLRIS